MTYFEKNTLFPPLTSLAPEASLSLVVTIPCYDEPDLLRTLDSLASCAPARTPVEVIVIINSAENAPTPIKHRNAETNLQAQAWAAQHNRPGLKFRIFHFPDLPPKHAGVGLARKIAMDEAARRLVQAGSPRGIITCLDADSQVQPNYPEAIENYFERHPGCPAASIYYEHPLDGDAFAPGVYEAIARYELHLRYYVHALRWAGLPYATQTVGSAMAVRADAYQAQGGMNRRQAGEDFYFLHKFTPLDGFGEITSTTVIPSPRPSRRVPFGTGKAVGDMLEGNTFLTYSPLIFRDLNLFLAHIDQWRTVPDTVFLPQHSPTLPDFWHALPPGIISFLETENFLEKILEIRANTASPESFRKRFFRWFDAFRAMKYVHHARDRFYPNIPVEDAVLRIGHYGLSVIGPGTSGNPDIRGLLEKFRNTDRKAGNTNH